MNNLIEFLKGKKTYFAAAIGLLYLAGVYLGFWSFDEKILAFFGLSALAFLRYGLGKTTLPLLLLPLLLVTGCQTALNSNKVLSETSWVVGLRVKTTDSTSGNLLPDVQLGVMRQTITMIPTSTNLIYAPKFGVAYSGKQNAWNPISTDAQESVFSGDVMISTNATGSAVIPKLSTPKHTP